ncbi:PREDICTED: serine/arginine-rich SC35-like splicing factor SCL30 [Ipomoea nil]|uniref:serine/arginine-rich SC35-like splicing factor SCL30 n=1 Tax=Ipomoea nil TaxID=35883 RepID=UPI0009019A6C|nr:PREDICTED: serine/arginine-rich SC35-like splicing factor SCL30 [Ipomoea nil]XP_019192038.1 PREDICTED: serine/arginine-rich SC35-like splicing factor SCL30 [Ipomoea nil]
MRRYSPAYYSPPRRGYGGRPRSPPRRGYGGGGRHREQNHGSLLVRNIPLDCRPEELRAPFERFGLVRDVYLPKDYYTGEPRGFAFVQFVDSYEAAEAQYHMDGKVFAGRQISVVVAAETRKRPEDMRRKSRVRGPSGYGGRSSHYGRSHSRSRSRSPPNASGSRARHRSRSYSPDDLQRRDYSVSPDRRHSNHPRSRREHGVHHRRRSVSPGYENIAGENGNSHGKEHLNEAREAQTQTQTQTRWRSSPRQTSRSPPRSRSRSADVLPRDS